MREIDAADSDAIGAGEHPHNWFLLFDFPSGLYGFHLGAGVISLDGVEYAGAGSFLEIEQIDAGLDLSASPIKVTLRAVPDTELTPDVLATIDDEQYKNRPVTLSLVYFNRDTGEVALPLRWWSGSVDTIEHDETVGGDYALVANLEPRSLDHSRRGFRMRSDTDQKMIDPDDRFFEHAATVGTEKLPYGRKTLNE